MDYQDSRETSAEYLRLALQQMRRHEAAFHPITYAVWYEYVSGRTAALRRDIDALIPNGGVLDEVLIKLLFRRYIAEVDQSTLEDVSTHLQQVLNEVSVRAQGSCTQAQAYRDTLQEFSHALAVEGGAPALRGEIEQILRHTQDIKVSMTELGMGLESSRHEIELLRRELRDAREQAHRDALTGLANRRGFDQALKDMVESSAKASQPLSLMVIDIDHFKLVNDRHGHMLGDHVLCAVADVLKASVKGKDFAARYGGEEFAVLLPGTPLGGGQTVAEEIRKSVARGRIRRLDSDALVGQVTVSAGVACLKPGEASETLFERADSALYESKNNGRNKVTVAW